MAATTTIDVCLCTFRRESVVDAVASVAAQSLPPDVSLRIIVADNDFEPSAAGRIEACSEEIGWPMDYIHAPAGNISVARNACLDAARGDWVAFMDDDEVASPGWLSNALGAARESGADIVFGPALARYPADTPDWIRDNDFHTNRPVRRGDEVETGHTCNVLIRFTGTPVTRARFDTRLGKSGGEDTDFFFRLHRTGMKMTICDDAIVEELVDARRLRLGWLVERRFAEGAHYGAAAPGSRALRSGVSAAKALYCTLWAALSFWNRTAVAFWFLRAVFHCGVSVGGVTHTRRVAYGKE